MGSLGGLTLALSSFCGLILLGVVLGVCYLFWWKMRYANGSRVVDEDCSSLLFWKKPLATAPSVVVREEQVSEEARDLEKAESNKVWESDEKCTEESVEMELRRMHQLLGPPRFLFPIKEESREDLESDRGTVKSRSKSLSEGCFYNMDEDTSSYSSFRRSFDSYSNMGVNPLFESMSADEINRLRSSPPPKLKFLRDAEDKLIKKTLILEYEQKLRTQSQNPQPQISRHEVIHSSQVLPLSSSPT